jgi:hypothetical protein
MIYGYILWAFVMLIIHEIGHAWLAKKQGIYKGWGIFPTPHIKVTKPYKSRWDYLMGFYFSLLSFPLWVVFVSVDMNMSMPISILWFLIICFGVAILDFFVFLNYKKLSETYPTLQ